MNSCKVGKINALAYASGCCSLYCLLYRKKVKTETGKPKSCEVEWNYAVIRVISILKERSGV